ncbi:MAG: BamA/TamA family outer membrane protein [Cyclobacteriaceae bacterium]
MKRILPFSLLLITGLWCIAQVPDSTELITINEIRIEGNKKTKRQFITRELSFKAGDQFQRFQLDSMFIWDRNRIYNTNVFNEVEFSLAEVANSVVDVIVTVDERWYFYPIPIFKLVDRNFNDWWVNRDRDLSRVNYGLRLSQFNFRGRGELLRVTGQFGFTQRVSFLYHLPYIEKKQRHGLRINFSYQEAKNLAVVTRNNVRAFLTGEDLLRTAYRTRVTHSYRSSFYSFHFLSLGHTSASIADTVVAINENYLGDGRLKQNYFTAGYFYTWDKRNNRNYATSGSWHTLGIRKFGLGLYDDVDFWSFEFRLSKYMDLGNDFYFAGNAIGVISLPEERDYFNYFSIGFLKNVLRGYDLNVVEGSSYFIQKNEFKKKLFSNKYDISRFMPVRQFQTFPITLYGKVYFDQGYARGYPNYTGSDKLDDQYLYSYGLGLDLMILYDAVFRFEYSRNTLGQTNLFINILAAI